MASIGNFVLGTIAFSSAQLICFCRDQLTDIPFSCCFALDQILDPFASTQCL